MKKYALAISGGAARGAFSLGCLQYFDDHNIEIEVLAGSSIGAAIASSYACGVSPKCQLEIFLSKEFRKAIEFNFFKNSILKINEDADIFKKLIPIEKIEDFPKKVTITATDICSGELLYFEKGDAIKAVIASCSLAPIFKPTEFDGRMLVDGGVKEHIPITPLSDIGLPIISINHFPIKERHKLSFYQTFFRMIYLAWHNSFNESISKSDIYITSEKLADIRLFSFKDLKKAYLLGYKECERVFNN